MAVELTGVPETMLWTLWFRAKEARRPDTVLPDPEAVRAVERTAFPFQERFGPPHDLMAQQMALRAAAFDGVTREFLDAFPDGTVVALGEGLETSFWRVDNSRVRWLTVDLPESLALRAQVLPSGPRQRTLACDARDARWLDGLDPAAGVLVTAEGLLMYLRPGEVRDVIRACAEGLPGGALVFDAVPRWFAARSRKRQLRMSTGWVAPPMPWGMDADQRSALRQVHPGVAEVRDVPLPPGRGMFWGRLAPWAAAVAPLARLRPTVTLLRFGNRGDGNSTDRRDVRDGTEGRDGRDGSMRERQS